VREFYGREFLIDRHTLDPRPDTETLIEAALDLVERSGSREQPLKLLDLGTGTGCILLTLLAELPEAHGVGTDIDEAALALATANARALGLDPRAAFMAADWLDGIEGPFDLILVNPPYIASGAIAGLAREVAEYDPRHALDGGPDGLEAYRRIASRAAKVLRPGGMLIVEIGASQAEAVLGLCRAGGLEIGGDSVRLDLAGRPRAVLAGRREGPERTAVSSKKGLESPIDRGSFGPTAGRFFGRRSLDAAGCTATRADIS
jgi:release factor glutamine methyltransferase